MSEQPSPLVQRVRRLLGTGALDADGNVELIAPLKERLDAIERRLIELSEHTRGPRDLSSDEQAVAAVREALAGLEKQISRAGREQLKANSLTEAQIEQLTAALEALRAADARRNEEIAAIREQSRIAQNAIRLEMVRGLFPVIDSLDEAIRSGQRLLEQHAPATLVVPTTLFERMRAQHQAQNRGDSPLREAMASWLVGLTFVRQRMLDLLAAEGVQPIAARGQPFDPQLHVAMEVVPATPEVLPGIVVAELRRGYTHGERVLRHAEVAVSGEVGNIHREA